MSDKRLSDVIKEQKIALTPEPLEGHEGEEFTLRGFHFEQGSFSEYVVMDVVDTNGENHLFTTGGATILRVLKSLDPETVLPLQVKFVKVTSGNARQVWSIE